MDEYKLVARGKKNGPAKARTVDRAWGLECQDTDDGNHTQNGG